MTAALSVRYAMLLPQSKKHAELMAACLQSIMKALQYLMWENISMSVKVLEAVYLACKKADPHALYHLAPVCLYEMGSLWHHESRQLAVTNM